jgi:uncharacterized phage infection (PIP) family protein YhgE
MADSVLGLSFEISADPSQAQDALNQFEKSTGKSFEAAAGSTRQFDTALLSNRESVRLLSEELGVHLPRAVSSAVAEMIPGLSAIGPALLGAFAIEEIPKLISGIRNAADEMAGFGKEAKKAFEDAIKASDKAITNFKTIKEGIKLEAEVNRNIAALSVQRDLLDSTGGAAINYARAVFEFLSGSVAAGAAHLALARAEKLDMEELGKLEAKRLEQLSTRTALEEREGKVKRDTARDLARELAEDNRFISEALESWARQDEAAERKRGEETERTVHEMIEAEKRWDRIVKEDAKEQVKAFEEVSKAMSRMPHSLDFLGGSLQKTLPKLTSWKLALLDAKQVSHEFAEAAKADVAAVQENIGGSLASLTQGAIALTGSQKAAAAFKVGYEIAEALACLASGTWPPNPAAIIAAGIHFEAAAQYAKVGGGGGGGRGTASVGAASSYGRGGGDGGGGSTPGPGGGGGITVHYHIQGIISNDTLPQLMYQMSQLAKGGQGYLTANNALTNGPKLT